MRLASVLLLTAAATAGCGNGGYSPMYDFLVGEGGQPPVLDGGGPPGDAPPGAADGYDFALAVSDDSGSPPPDFSMVVNPPDLSTVTSTADLTGMPPPDLTGVSPPDLTPSSCSDGQKDGDETDIDCGGSICPRCATAKMCNHGSDCQSLICTNQRCDPPTCSDTVKNGTETDVDCGGMTCPGCINGKMCFGAGDCQSKICTNNLCKQGPTCADNVKNGMESDVDCGSSTPCPMPGIYCGPTCAPCANGRACSVAADCQSGICKNNLCVPAPNCSDGVKNGSESDIDCGSSGMGACPPAGCPMCLPCLVGKICARPSDCASVTCTGGLCAPSPCMNGIKDGMETDVDCGGPVCQKCVNGKVCLAANDCQSAICKNNLCVPAPTCTDGIKNGMETDVDCGGPVCPKCGFGKACNVPSDCASGQCKNSSCAGAFTVVSFSMPMRYATGFAPWSVATGDFNGDNKVDLAVANTGMTAGGTSNNVSILLGKGDGTFTLSNNYPVGASPFHVVVADINRDNKPDLVVTNEAGDSVSVLIGSGTGTFVVTLVAASVPAGSNPYSTAVGDFNGDGFPDLAVANYGNATGTLLSLFTGNGNGTFTPRTGLTTVGGGLGHVITADFNGDAKLDLAVTILGSAGTSINVFYGLGTGSFNTAVSFPAGNSPRSIATADFNSDGKPDLVTANLGQAPFVGSSLSVYLNNGSTFGQPTSLIAGQGSRWVVTGDVNRDARQDIAVANIDAATVSVLLGNGNGSFQAALTFSCGMSPRSLATADFNGDGALDFAVASETENGIDVLLNTSK